MVKSKKVVIFQFSHFDTYQNTDSVKVLLDSLKNMDLIVGPMYQKNFNIVKDFFYESKTLVISAYINNINSTNYSNNIFFTECNELDQLKYISKFISENIMIIIFRFSQKMTPCL